MKIVFLIENLRLFSTEQIELSSIAKKMNYEVRYFETLRTKLKIENLTNIIKENEKYIIFSSIYTLKALLLIDNFNEFYNDEELKKLNIFKKYIYYDLNKFNNINTEFSFNKFENIEMSLLKKFTESKFIKSTTGLKEFESGIINKNESLFSYMKRTKGNTNIIKNFYKDKTKNINILVANINNSTAKCNEYRFFIMNNEIISKSQYIEKGDFECKEDIPNKVIEFAINFMKIYQPDFYYVLDLIEINNEIKFLEFNCINSSGLYDINKEDFVKKLLLDKLLFEDRLSNKSYNLEEIKNHIKNNDLLFICKYLEHNNYNKKIVLNVLKSLTYFNYDYVYPYGQILTLKLFEINDIEVKDFVLQLYDCWNNEKGLIYLNKLEVKEKWLNEYKSKVIESIENHIK